MRTCGSTSWFVSAEEAKEYLGRWRTASPCSATPPLFVRGLGLESLPAFVFVRGDGSVEATAQGWDPAEWKHVAKAIADTCAWIPPRIPMAGDPSPFRGTPAAG